MLAKVDGNVREFLLSQPESGMGYQLVQTSGSGNRLLIMNAELCINLEHMHELAGYQDQDGRIIVDGDIQVIDIEPKSIIVNTHGSFRSNSTVAPNYSQSGGGVEVRFEQDTPPSTLIQTDTIPDR